MAPVRPLLVRAASSPRSRRLVPLRVANAAIEAFAAVARRRRAAPYEDVRAFHAALLARTPLAGREDEVAERGLAELWKMVELFWRPWLLDRGELVGRQHLDAARAEDRGVVLVFPHFGVVYAQFPILSRHGIDTWVIAAPHHYEELGEGYHDRFKRQGRRYLDLLGPGRSILQGNGFGRALDILRDGGTVSVAFDVVGSMPTPFLGRTVMLASGPARLAHAAGSMVVPFVTRARDARVSMELAPPLDAREFPDPAALQAAIAARMERWALERPEAVWQLDPQPGGPPLIKDAGTAATAG